MKYSASNPKRQVVLKLRGESTHLKIIMPPIKIPRALFLVSLCLWFATLACTLTSETASTPEPVDTDGWVSFPGKGVQISAPPGEWSLVPFDDPLRAGVLLEEWNNRDETVVNLFRDLSLASPYSPNAEFRLILMKDNGTAWLQITAETIDPALSTRQVIEETRRRLWQAIEPQEQTEVTLSAGGATRWQVIYSPPGSQILNHQLQYLVRVGTLFYVLSFDAQAADFADYAPVFEKMAESFIVNPLG